MTLILLTKDNSIKSIKLKRYNKEWAIKINIIITKS